MWTSLGDHYLAYPTYLLILLAVHFSKQSFKNSNKVHFITFLMECAFGMVSKNSSNQRSPIFFLIFLYKTYNFPFSSMTHFYLTFVKGVKSESRLIILPGCSFLLVAVTNYHKLSGLKLHKYISLQFFHQEYNMHFLGSVTSRDSNRESFPCISSFRRTPEFLDS